MRKLDAGRISIRVSPLTACDPRAMADVVRRAVPAAVAGALRQQKEHPSPGSLGERIGTELTRVIGKRR